MDKGYKYVYEITAEIIRDLESRMFEAMTDNDNSTSSNDRKDTTTCQTETNE